jgi:hypothetical protein
VFSPAEIQGFLLKRKKEPRKALDEVEGWVEGELKGKKGDNEGRIARRYSSIESMELMLSDFLFYMVEGKLKLKNLQMNSSLLFDLGS